MRKNRQSSDPRSYASTSAVHFVTLLLLNGSAHDPLIVMAFMVHVIKSKKSCPRGMIIGRKCHKLNVKK